MAEVAIKELDPQGRVVIPKAWRSKHLRGKRVIMKLKEDGIEIVSYAALDLTKFFDRIPVDVKSDLRDWHAVRRELRSR
jgi:bifunctional DNA-binding transcriptional regulator/antitoxin component of YhaV-PrlF toxin-antitoxin module